MPIPMRLLRDVTTYKQKFEGYRDAKIRTQTLVTLLTRAGCVGGAENALKLFMLLEADESALVKQVAAREELIPHLKRVLKMTTDEEASEEEEEEEE